MSQVAPPSADHQWIGPLERPCPSTKIVGQSTIGFVAERRQPRGTGSANRRVRPSRRMASRAGGPFNAATQPPGTATAAPGEPPFTPDGLRPTTAVDCSSQSLPPFRERQSTCRVRAQPPLLTAAVTNNSGQAAEMLV